MEVIKVETEICRYFPVKTVIPWYLSRPVPLFEFLGAKPKWEEGLSELSGFTIIGRNYNNLFCDMNGYIIGDIISSTDVERNLLKEKGDRKSHRNQKKRGLWVERLSLQLYTVVTLQHS